MISLFIGYDKSMKQYTYISTHIMILVAHDWYIYTNINTLNKIKHPHHSPMGIQYNAARWCTKVPSWIQTSPEKLLGSMGYIYG